MILVGAPAVTVIGWVAVKLIPPVVYVTLILKSPFLGPVVNCPVLGAIPPSRALPTISQVVSCNAKR